MGPALRALRDGPSAVDVAHIPEAVRQHALVMRKLNAETREIRKSWYELRDLYQTGHNMGGAEIASVTANLWRAELALADAAAVYREQLAENNARPASERWSPTVLAIWARRARAVNKLWIPGERVLLDNSIPAVVVTAQAGMVELDFPNGAERETVSSDRISTEAG